MRYEPTRSRIDQPVHTWALMPLMVVMAVQLAPGPYLAQSLLLLQSLQQMLLPPEFRAHHMRYGEFGQAASEAQVSEHQPWPEPPLTQRPDVHSELTVHGLPGGRLTQKFDGEQTWLP
jgi:hypothetical protein